MSVGVNDRNYGDKNIAIVEPLSKTIAWLRERNIQPIVLTNTPCKDSAFTETNTSQVVQASIVKSCDEMNIHCYNILSEVDFYLWIKDISLDDIMTDDLHLNDMGHEITFYIVKKLLQL